MATSYASELSEFNGAAFGGAKVAGGQITDRVLMVTFEDGAATTEQAKILEFFVQNARNMWPNVRIVYQFIP